MRCGWIGIAVGCSGAGGIGDDTGEATKDEQATSDLPESDGDADVDSDADGDADPSDGAELQVGHDESFTPRTWSYNPNGGALVLSLTDLEGLTACGLGDDPSVEPGQAASQLLAMIATYDSTTCPEGLTPLGRCESYGDSCVDYRRWDAVGTRVVLEHASAGAIRITQHQSRCLFELEATFDGVTLETSVEIPFGGERPPFCLD